MGSGSMKATETVSAAILVLNWNGRSLLQTCLPLLLNQTVSNYEVVVVDNGSSDASVSFVTEQFPQVRLIQNEKNLGFSRGINAGLRQISADVVVLLNNDVLVQPNWLAELLRPFQEDSQIGIIGSKLLYPDGTIQHLGAELTYPLARSHHFHYKKADVDELPAVQDVPYVTGAAMAVHRSVLTRVGLLDEMFHPFYYEEVDFCYRAKAAGFRVVVATQAVAVHDESVSMNKVQDLKLQTLQRNRYRFVLKHYSIEQFLQEFVPAETAQLASNQLFADVDAIRLACLQTAVAAPTILPPNSTVEQITAVQKALLQLRETAILAKATQETPPPTLHEFTFPQTDSPFQPLIAKFRAFWSSIAAKWLVRSLQQQQSYHNQFLQRQIKRMGVQARSQSMEIEQLLAALLPTQQAQKQLQVDLAALQKQLDDLATERKQPS
jgi:GT2 family glycosyltransferase